LHLLSDPGRFHALIAANARDEWKPSIADAAQWLSDPRHFALVEGNDLAMFEAEGEWPGELAGHMFFASRGRDALKVAKAMLGQAFAYGATAITGETPERYPEALWFIRQLGFRPVGEKETPNGKAILSRLDKAPPISRSAVA
jgi:hypothetical protein